MRISLGGLALLLFLSVPGYGFGATIRLSVVAPGHIHLEAVDFQNVAAADLTLTFGTGAIQAPQVQAGSLIAGALLVSNPAIPGQLRLAFIHASPVTGSGLLAEVRGTAGSEIQGLNLQGSLRDPQGQVVPLRVGIASEASRGRQRGRS